jgi:Mrp family chromosome partitioning ATPase
MSKRTHRFGNRPEGPDDSGGGRSVPLPMVTQPMAAVSPEDAAALRASVPGLAAADAAAAAAAAAGASPAGGSHRVSPHAVAAEAARAAMRPGPTPASADDFSRPTVMDGSLAAVAAAAARSVAPRDPGNVTMSSSASAALAGPSVGAQVARQPPEIGLTQHHLPDDAEPDGRLVLVNDPDSERAAAFRVLRHHLLEAGRPQVIVVSSPRPGEGKTTVATNVALALAECGRAKVLLVETNVRRPQLAEVFQFTPPWCFAEQLAAHRHQPMLPWGFVDIPQVWLHVAAINPRLEQNQLLDAPAFAIAMDRLRLGGYDHIVIDSPPVLGSADVNLIQDAADGALLVVRGRISTSRELRMAIDQLSPAKILGSVLLEQ